MVIPDDTAKDNVLLEWEAPARPFEKRTKEFYKTATAIVFLVAVILVFVGEFFLIGAILAVYFAMYALSTVPPEKIRHRITNLGIETAGHFHKWEEMREFWVTEKSGQKMAVISLLLGFPSHLYLLVGDVAEEKLKKVLSERVPYLEKAPVTFLDQASTWLAQKVPLEKAR